jgi:ribonuclease HII
MASVEEILAKPVPELKRLLLDGRRAVPRGLLEALANDGRRGARELAGRIRARRRKDRAEAQRLRKLFLYEAELWSQGINMVAGVDEAGMAPLAGPVVAAAVILPRNYRLRGLNDSKKILVEAKREEMAAEIKRDALCWSVGRAEVEEIDRLNIYHAGLLAMRRAVEGLSIRPDFALVDARRIPACPCPQRGIIRAGRAQRLPDARALQSAGPVGSVAYPPSQFRPGSQGARTRPLANGTLRWSRKRFNMRGR